MAEQPVKILIADDDVDDLEMLEEALLEARPEATITKAVGGVKAMELLNEYSDSDLPNIIVLDYNMPDLPGAEILSALDQQPRYAKVPRVVFSTSDAPRHVSDCLTRGATKYFVKPSTKKELDKIAMEMLSLATQH